MNDARAIAAWVGLALAFIGALIGGTWSIATILAKVEFVDLLSDAPILTTIAGASLLTGAAIIGLLFYKKTKLSRNLVDRDSMAAFKILQFVTICHVKDRNHWTFVDRWWVEGKTSDCRYLKTKFAWTGPRDSIKISASNNSHEIEIEESSNFYNNLIVDLGPDFHIGHREVVEIEFDCLFSANEEPHTNVTLTPASDQYPMLNSFLGLLAEENVDINSVYREVYNSGSSDIAVTRDSVDFSTDHAFLWPISPKPGKRYVLRWNF